VGDLASNLRRRVQRSRELLRAAREADNDYEIDIYSAELEDLLRRAAMHGVHIDDAEDTPLQAEDPRPPGRAAEVSGVETGTAEPDSVPRVRPGRD
jgi:hypothetical protein